MIRESDRLGIEAERYRRIMPPLSLVPVPKRSSGPQDETFVERGSLDLLLDCGTAVRQSRTWCSAGACSTERLKRLLG